MQNLKINVQAHSHKKTNVKDSSLRNATIFTMVKILKSWEPHNYCLMASNNSRLMSTHKKISSQNQFIKRTD